MCTMIAEKVALVGSAKAKDGWFPIDKAYVAYDHPFHYPEEHALTLDFVNESMGTAARVAVELPAPAARLLAERILEALRKAGEQGVIPAEVV
ncbi:MAG: DUF6295 family protein [Dehalococcoidia bacterium]